LKGKGFAAATTADYYVSPEGNDTSGDGSAANPWASIAHADAQVGPGSTVHVATGTYTGSFSTNASGTASAYITYISDTKWGAKIVGGSFSTWSNYGAYVEIQHFDVTGPKSSCCEGIYTAGNATRIIGDNVHDTQSANGCNVTGGAGNNSRGIFDERTTVTHNVYTHNHLSPTAGGNDDSNCKPALQHGNTATGTVSANPQFLDVAGDAAGDCHSKPRPQPLARERVM